MTMNCDVDPNVLYNNIENEKNLGWGLGSYTVMAF